MKIRLIIMFVVTILLILMLRWTASKIFMLQNESERNAESISINRGNLEYWYRHSDGRLQELGGPIGIGYNMETPLESSSYNVFIGEIK